MPTNEPELTLHTVMIMGQHALGLTQRKFGELIGVSHRTVQRWTSSGPMMTADMLVAFAKALHPVRPDYAAFVAKRANHTLESLGLVKPPPPPPPPAPVVAPRAKLPAQMAHLVAEAILYAASDDLAVSRELARTSLLASLDRAGQASMTLEELVVALKALPIPKRPAVEAKQP